jgi:uncharacterized protein (TIGR02679 family)
VELLDRPVYQPLWAAARRRVEANGLSLEGTPLTLKGLTPEEADAIAGLLGVRRPVDGSLRVPLSALDRALRLSVVGRGLLETLAVLGGPPVDRRALKVRSDADRERQWAELKVHSVIRNDLALTDWLDHLHANGVARRLAGDDEGEVVSVALDVLAALRGRESGHRLAVLAAEVTGDAHGLDRGKPAGTLVVHALSWLAAQPFPGDAADWRRTWSEAGVACDDLSCDVLVLNLPGWSAEPLRLTLRQVSSWQSRATAGGTVYVSENPAVVAAAADQLAERSPTMVCLDGMPSTAALVVLDGLAGAGWAVRYHGDFDWRGLGIASVLARKITIAVPWRFGVADYRRAVQGGLGTIALSGRAFASPWDEGLRRCMEDVGVAVYEEQVLDDLLDDLARCPFGERTPPPQST